MSNRQDVTSGRLVYTCNCGWVDTGHMDSGSRRPHVGAQSLWDQISKETGDKVKQNGMNRFLVTYTQDMRKKVAGFWLSASETRTFVEGQQLQPGRPRLGPDRVLLRRAPGSDYLKLCGPVSVKASLDVWDKFGAVGIHKNQTFDPVFHGCVECKAAALFPKELQSIQPAKKGVNHFDWKPPGPPQPPRAG